MIKSLYKNKCHINYLIKSYCPHYNFPQSIFFLKILINEVVSGDKITTWFLFFSFFFTILTFRIQFMNAANVSVDKITVLPADGAVTLCVPV